MYSVNLMAKSVLGLVVGICVGAIIGGVFGLAMSGPHGVIMGMILGAMVGSVLGAGAGFARNATVQPTPAATRREVYGGTMARREAWPVAGGD